VTYSDFFQKATGRLPYPYQIRLSEGDLPEVLRIPTGAGKTAAIILAWLYRRFHGKNAATRLVFCLPMRVLVKQTISNVEKWLSALGLESKVDLYELMGGFSREEENWERHPLKPAIILGTQDMLLSRALNRGYAMSRFRWSVPFGLLHNDCQWVFDEVQLMGVARATSVQLQAFREHLGTYGAGRSLWMSATLQSDWLATVDRDAPTQVAELTGDDLKFPALRERMQAAKRLQKSALVFSKETKKDYGKALAAEAQRLHQAGSLSLVIVNQVARAVEAYQALLKQLKGVADAPPVLLLHSRFRPPERAKKEQVLSAWVEQTPPQGAIIISTQVVEAGVDLSSRLLISELCPFSSLVQRIGRCNRDGREPGGGTIYWIDLQDGLLPYTEEEISDCRSLVENLHSVNPEDLATVNFSDDAASDRVLRYKDTLELYETTSDLAGEDVDVSAYIREPNHRDAQIFWRDFEGKPTEDERLPSRDELCSVSLSDLRDFAGKGRVLYRWSYSNEAWVGVDRNQIKPGQVYLTPSSSGGYDPDLGFSREAKSNVLVVDSSAKPEKFGAELQFHKYRLSLADHTQNVLDEMKSLLQAASHLALPSSLLESSCLWHDYGKTHDVFQDTMYGDQLERPELLAKTDRSSRGHCRRGFRHEFASALAALQLNQDPLLIYLVATHHGKVRFSTRPLPQEQIGSESELTIKGIKDGDVLPAFEPLGIEDPTKLNLSYLELGHPRGWARTLLPLCQDPNYGIFRLGYLEALMRTADTTASEKEGLSLKA
jgi:CRISPR-associated endonuclease/helicase Cas3